MTLLAGAKAVQGAAANAWALAEALCFTESPEQRADDERGYWGALLAAQVLTENKSVGPVAERNRAKVERIRRWLTCTFRHGVLPPIDRTLAGEALASIGDPRFCAEAWYLPDEPLLGFIEIPAGPFLMGSDPKRDTHAGEDEQPQHRVTLPRCYIARYPVTVAQFRAFVEESGYRLEDGDSLRGLANHPVVYVTWHDALAYCKWLTERLQRGEGIPESVTRRARQEGWEVTLPSEAKWEKAARGTEGWLYPWGNEFREDRANTGEAGIGGTSAVGCFPLGKSPVDCLDMAGNVWEWTRSLWVWEAYPYPDGQKGRAEREALDAPDDRRRMLRGGAFFPSRRHARGAYRRRSDPNTRFDDIGFRVVVLPKKL